MDDIIGMARWARKRETVIGKIEWLIMLHAQQERESEGEGCMGGRQQAQRSYGRHRSRHAHFLQTTLKPTWILPATSCLWHGMDHGSGSSSSQSWRDSYYSYHCCYATHTMSVLRIYHGSIPNHAFCADTHQERTTAIVLRC
jgi:hypothetical protein